MKIIRKTAIWIVVSLLLCLIPATALAADDSTLTIDDLTIPGGESVIRILVDNRDTIDHSYKLSVENTPEGFSMYFMADGKVTENLELSAQNSKIVELHVSAPSQPTQDNYRFSVNCTRNDGQAATSLISVTINGDYAVEIATQIQKLEVISGKSISFDVVVTNTGNNELKDLGVITELPYKWTVESVVPSTISIASGESAVFKIGVLVPSSQVAGNAEIKLSARNSEVQSLSVSIPVIVSSSTNYVLIIIGCVVVVGLVTIIYFRKHGRR